MCFCSLSYPTRLAHAPCYVVTCGLSGSTTFSHIIAHKTRFFLKPIMSTQGVFSFSVQLLSETFLVLRTTERHTNRTVYRSARKVPFVVVRFNLNLNLLYGFSENTKISNFTKTRSVAIELFHANLRTDRHDEAHGVAEILKNLFVADLLSFA